MVHVCPDANVTHADHRRQDYALAIAWQHGGDKVML
jgi:hypothetical protein